MSQWVFFVFHRRVIQAWNCVKSGIPYMIFAPLYSLNKLKKVRASLQIRVDRFHKSHSVWWSQTDFYLRTMRPVGGYQTCLIFLADVRTLMLFSFACLIATMCMFLREFVVYSLCLSCLVYDSQFSFGTIYKVGECIMSGVLKICSDFKSCVVYYSLKSWQNFGVEW